MQKAYTLNGRLLRPALVMVAKAPEADGTDAGADETTEENIDDSNEDPGADSGES